MKRSALFGVAVVSVFLAAVGWIGVIAAAAVMARGGRDMDSPGLLVGTALATVAAYAADRLSL